MVNFSSSPPMPGGFELNLPLASEPAHHERTISLPDDFRHGKFATPSDLMILEPTTISPEAKKPQWLRAGLADPRPGQLIYIKDETPHETRVHNRVMVVLRQNGRWTMTCLGLCHHETSADPDIHWAVRFAGRPPQTSPDSTSSRCLDILLKYGDETPRLNPNITINIRDLWNVEYEVFVLILGRVKTSSLMELKREVKHMFCKTLDQAIPDPIQEAEPERGQVNISGPHQRRHKHYRK